MLGSIINRLILLELVKVFVLALTALTGLFLVAGLIQETSQRGLSLVQVVSIIPLIIPSMLPYTIPTTTLFATCVVYGRMAHDNEIVVLKSAGVNILHMLKPALLLGVMSSALTMFLFYEAIPRSQRVLRERIMADAEEVMYGLIKRERSLRQVGMQYVMYVRDVQGKRLVDVIFKKRNQQSTGYDVVARTREARLRVDAETREVVVDMGRCTVVGEKDGVGADVNEQIYRIPLPDSLAGKDNKNRTGMMTWPELHIRRVEAEAEYLNSPFWTTPGPQAEAQLEHLMHVYKNIEVEIQMRPVLAIGCICFVLIGCPVGIWASRSDYLSTFVICFMPTLFIYYPLLLAGMNMAKDGRIAAEIGCWIANVALGSLALTLIWRLMRR